MKITTRIVKKIDKIFLKKIITKRKPDFIIPYTNKTTYMKRWHVIPKNKFFNIYLHEFSQPDPDNILHDHPWFSISYILYSGYTEHTIKNGGIHCHKELKRGNLKFRIPWYTHRISHVLVNQCRTLFITGPVLRTWGFHQPIMGWMEHLEYKKWRKEN